MLDDLLLVLQPVEQYQIWDIMAYIIFGLALIGLIISGEDEAIIPAVFAFALMGAVIDKTYAVGWFLEPNTATLQMRIDTHLATFWVMIMRGLMFSTSMMGIMSAKKKGSRTVFIILTLLLLVYTLGRWWDQDGAAFFASR